MIYIISFIVIIFKKYDKIYILGNYGKLISEGVIIYYEDKGS